MYVCMYILMYVHEASINRQEEPGIQQAPSAQKAEQQQSEEFPQITGDEDPDTEYVPNLDYLNDDTLSQIADMVQQNFIETHNTASNFDIQKHRCMRRHRKSYQQQHKRRHTKRPQWIYLYV